jgi:hypothetical protein
VKLAASCGTQGCPRSDLLEPLTEPEAGGLGQVGSDSREVGLVLRRLIACLVEQDDLRAKEGDAISLRADFVEGSRHGLVPEEDPVPVRVFVEEELAGPGSVGLVGAASPDPVNR